MYFTGVARFENPFFITVGSANSRTVNRGYALSADHTYRHDSLGCATNFTNRIVGVAMTTAQQTIAT
jgi:hypothetical protein